MNAKVEAGIGWVFGELDGWGGERGIKREVTSGNSAHLGTEYDTAAMLIEPGKGSTRVTVYPGLTPLSVEVSGIVSEIPMMDCKKPQIRHFELKGIDACIKVSHSGKILLVRNS